MTTFSIALGVSGTLTYQADYRDPATVTGDFAMIRTGAKNWPAAGPTRCSTTRTPTATTTPSRSTTSGTPRSTAAARTSTAGMPTSVIQGVGAAMSKIEDKLATGTADGTSTLQPVAGNNFTYSTSYFSGSWQGDVAARLINVNTGDPGAAIWSAKGLLDTHTFAACDDRKILLFRGGTTLVPFTWETQMCPGGVPSGTPVTDLLPAETALVGATSVMALTHYATMTDGSAQHGAAAAGSEEGRQAPQLPARPARQRKLRVQLADAVVPAPRSRARRHRQFASRSTSVSRSPITRTQLHGLQDRKSRRPPMLYVGANDGMLHAFYARHLLDRRQGGRRRGR